MPQGKDLFANARLVEEARLHLATILDGRYSEQFFYCFFKIIERKIYFGYYTFGNREVELKGIIDFIHNKHYGFGLRGLDQLMISLSNVMIYDDSESQYARQVIRWLKEQSPLLKLPAKAYEFERLLSWVRYRKKTSKVTNKEIVFFIEIYNRFPAVLKEIGSGRKFKTFEQAAVFCGIVEKVKKNTIQLNSDMTLLELEKMAQRICGLLGSERNCKLIELLISAQESANAGQIAVNDAEAADFDAGYNELATVSLVNRIRDPSDCEGES